MEIPGTCQLCQTVGSLKTCKLCGLLVCAKHYAEQAGCCTRCSPRRTDSSQEGEPANLPPLPEDAGDRAT